MTTALIADDEEAPRQQLRAALAIAWPELEIVAEAGNGVDAWDLFLAHEPALCFLDVRMPGLTGIEVARRIDGGARVVFVTAYGDHALAAFDAGAVDYLVKPVDLERLARTVAKAKTGLEAVPAALGEDHEPVFPHADLLQAALDAILRAPAGQARETGMGADDFQGR